MSSIKYPRSINNLEDTRGCLVVEHVPTGRVYVDVSKKLKQGAMDIHSSLVLGEFDNRRMQINFDMDPDMKYIGYPCKTISEARKLAKDIMDSTPTMVLLNLPPPKFTRRRKRS